MQSTLSQPGELVTLPSGALISARTVLAGHVCAALLAAEMQRHDRPSAAPTTVKQSLELSAHFALAHEAGTALRELRFQFKALYRAVCGETGALTSTDNVSTLDSVAIAFVRDTLRQEQQLIVATLEAAPANPLLARLVADTDYELAQWWRLGGHRLQFCPDPFERALGYVPVCTVLVRYVLAHAASVRGSAVSALYASAKALRFHAGGSGNVPAAIAELRDAVLAVEDGGGSYSPSIVYDHVVASLQDYVLSEVPDNIPATALPPRTLAVLGIANTSSEARPFLSFARDLLVADGARDESIPASPSTSRLCKASSGTTRPRPGPSRPRTPAGSRSPQTAW